MANRLVPKDFEDDDELFLEPQELIQRLRTEFLVVETDQAVAKEMVAKMITDIEKNSARGFDPWLENDERLERFRAGVDDAYFVYVADEPESKTNYLTTVVMPNEPLFFGYTSTEHEEQSRPLLERFAKAIDYDIEK